MDDSKVMIKEKNTENVDLFQTKKNQKTELSVPDTSFVSWHILLFSHLKAVRQLLPTSTKALSRRSPAVNKHIILLCLESCQY